ncbi:hypothetical protein EGX44_00560 [Yersinia pseudotuberculosis]|nr:hypothetical protein EGX44_00560 [Yersinia pseudotuberculosis]
MKLVRQFVRNSAQVGLKNIILKKLIGIRPIKTDAYPNPPTQERKIMRLLTKCPRRREQADRKDAVNTSMLGSSRAILGADALLLCLSSPFKIASSGVVSSLIIRGQDDKIGGRISEIRPAQWQNPLVGWRHHHTYQAF